MVIRHQTDFSFTSSIYGLFYARPSAERVKVDSPLNILILLNLFSNNYCCFSTETFSHPEHVIFVLVSMVVKTTADQIVLVAESFSSVAPSISSEAPACWD